VIRLALIALAVAVLAYVILRFRRDVREDALARARAAFFVRIAEPAAPGRRPATLRDVELGEGRLRLRLPEGWEVERSTRGALEARASSSRLLQAVVGGASPGAPRDAEALAESLRRGGPGRQGVVRVLPGDRVLLKHVEAGSDDRGRFITYCWELHSVAPKRPVVARFGFRVPGGVLDAITEDDLRLLDREICGSRLSSAS